jgi:hypothetical protein
MITASLSASELEIYSEYSSYNITYEDENQITGHKTGNNRYSIPTDMITLGAWYKSDFDKDFNEVWGIGIVNNKIFQTSKEVYGGKIVEQNKKDILVPYIFIGRDCYYWALEIGVSWYFTTEVKSERRYLNEVDTGKESWGLTRSESHTIPNFEIRILPKDWFHIKLFMSRGEFSPIDSLLGINFTLPRKKLIYALEVSMLLPKQYLYDDLEQLKSNQRIKFSLAYNGKSFNIGTSLGILIKNGVTGKGSIGFLNTLSFGTNISLKW